jgi:hypothetical protein
LPAGCSSAEPASSWIYITKKLPSRKIWRGSFFYNVDEQTGIYNCRPDSIAKTTHLYTLDELQNEFDRSQELFIKDHQRRYPGQPADAWKILEVASMGTLSKLYKSMKINLPEKLNNPIGAWFSRPLKQGQLDKPFSTISCMDFLADFIRPEAKLYASKICLS